MDGWKDGGMNGWMVWNVWDGMDRWVCVWVGGWIDESVSEWHE